VVCYRSCHSHEINITRVLLSKFDMHKMDGQKCHSINSVVHVGLSVYSWSLGGLININACQKYLEQSVNLTRTGVAILFLLEAMVKFLKQS